MPRHPTEKLPFGASVTAVDFGFASANDFWSEVVLRAHSRFLGHESRQHAIEAAWAAWHLHEWLWQEMHPGAKASGSDYNEFRDGLLDACPELACMRDVVDASKHRGLSRGAGAIETAEETKQGSVPGHVLRVHVEGTEQGFEDLLERVIDWWKTRHFPS